MADETMELDEFIATTLKQIIEGVRRARDEIEEGAGHINPTVKHATYSDPRDVDFDVAVTVSSGEGASGGAGIKMFGAQIGGELKKDTATQAVQRIKFSVPVSFPHTAKTQYPDQY